MSNDYHLLSTMVNSPVTYQKPSGGYNNKEDATVQVTPYGGNYYTYGQNGGEHQFVNYGGLYQNPGGMSVDQQAQQQMTSQQPIVAQSQGVGQADPMVEHFQLGKYLAGRKVPQPQQQPQKQTTTNNASAQSADIEKLMSVLNRNSEAPGAPTYLELLASNPSMAFNTSHDLPYWMRFGNNQGN